MFIPLIDFAASVMLRRLTTLATTREGCAAATACILAAEVVGCLLIIHRVRYTEIDWKAYMQEVQGAIDGERDYTNLRGNTGPLVYPAGFVYVFGALHWLTGADPDCCRLPHSKVSESLRCVSGGGDVRLAQYVFMLIYLCTLALVLRLYWRSETVPPWAFILASLSMRIHSLYLLRLFNDCVAMLFVYGCASCFARRSHAGGVLLFSAALSLKMNALLFAPAIALILVRERGWLVGIAHGAACALSQIGLALPFLKANARGYVSKAFELSRSFDYQWSVNFRFVSPEAFGSQLLAVSLLALHLSLLLWFAHSKWCYADGGLIAVLRGGSVARREPWSFHKVLVVMFTSNFIGVACARTLHYQFYSYYFHSLPLLLWHTQLPTAVRLALWLGVEAAFNVYPATAWSSIVLQGSHAFLLVALSRRAPEGDGRRMRDSGSRKKKA